MSNFNTSHLARGNFFPSTYHSEEFYTDCSLMVAYRQVTYTPLFRYALYSLPSRTDVSHNNEGGITARRKASAVLQSTQEETLFSPGRYPHLAVDQLE